VLRPGSPFFVQDLSWHVFLPGLRGLALPESLFSRAELTRVFDAAAFAVEVAWGRALVFVRGRCR
jgi:hypothetical protein